MTKPSPRTWASFPNLRGMAKEILPMLGGVLLGFVATIIAIALQKGFLEIVIWGGINTRHIMLSSGGISLIFFLFSIIACMYFRAVDYEGVKEEDWIGSNDVKERAKKDCVDRGKKYLRNAIVFFYFGLFMLFAGMGVVVWKLHVLLMIPFVAGASWATFRLLYMIIFLHRKV